MTSLLGLARRLLTALPRAWAADRVFRNAAIGAAVALGILLARLGAGDGSEGNGTRPSARAPLPPPGARYEPPVIEAPDTAQGTPLAPGRGLDGVTITRDPDEPADRFGTSRP